MVICVTICKCPLVTGKKEASAHLLWVLGMCVLRYGRGEREGIFSRRYAYIAGAEEVEF
jgi:hypothetical protein